MRFPDHVLAFLDLSAALFFGLLCLVGLLAIVDQVVSGGMFLPSGIILGAIVGAMGAWSCWKVWEGVRR